MTQLQRANAGEVTPQIEQVAAIEYRTPEEIRLHVAEGKIVIPANIHHKNLKPMGIGRLLRTKINANIGNSALSSCPMQELEKLIDDVNSGKKALKQSVRLPLGGLTR